KAVDQAGAQPLRGMKIVAPDGTVLEGSYPTTGPWRGYRDHALAFPREALDRILVERARGFPVVVRERHRVPGLARSAGAAAAGGRGGRGGAWWPRRGTGSRARSWGALLSARTGVTPRLLRPWDSCGRTASVAWLSSGT